MGTVRTIRISEDVWNAIAAKGRFGETPDDVLRRVFKIENKVQEIERPSYTPHRRIRIAKQRMTAKVSDNHLFVGFLNGPSKQWSLPSRDDKASIRSLLDQAIKFAADNGATVGQQYAVRKSLTNAGIFITK